MPVGTCELHGFFGFVEVCKHLDAAIERGERHDTYEVAYSLLCRECVEQFGFGGRKTEMAHRGMSFIEADFDDFTEYDAFNAESSFRCTECVAHWELNSWRASGLGDPFHAYEHTQTTSEQADRLQDEFLEAFALRKVRLCSGELEHALCVSKGSLRWPTRIIVQFVEDRTAQDSMSRWIEDYFAGEEDRQREVWFYRSFEVRKHPDGSCSQGNMGLLRMVETDPPPPGLRRHRWSGPPYSLDDEG